MPTAGGPADYGYYWWLYPERRLVEAWGGAGQRISLFPDLGVVVVMTADIPDDIPRSPVAARVYDIIEHSIRSSEPIPANPPAVSDLKHAVMQLTTR
jgi:CubicO group peptidase (beta-lactamase class C family)